MDKVNKWLSIINLGLWTGLFISIFCVKYDANTLRDFAIGATFVVVGDIFLDLLSNRRERIKKVK